MDSLETLDGEGPLWQQIRRALAKNIASGRWPPGAKIPKETDLIARYGAARMTVHRAIRSLASEGLVQRKRKFGTVVAVRPPDRPVLEIWDIAGEVARSGGRYSFTVIEREILKSEDPRREVLAVPADTPLLWLVSLHSANDEPLQLEERVINLATAPQAEAEKFDAVPPGTWLLNHLAWTEAEHTISAQEAPRGIAQKLDMLEGSACLVVERRTWNDDAPITFARLWHDGARRRLSGRFQPLKST
ncbi:UTRA domain-containing protein [Methylovirgula sp. 4M-Z18]|uniref:UTRA domain-containing protein n=1 Tax=Methylovirgula sp. 4M-Z18 TaxID=2293567 RepID=UPI0018F742C3|nr:UTRA domain-containing protein [Methylovirgula sp. 4M-Z18]